MCDVIYGWPICPILVYSASVTVSVSCNLIATVLHLPTFFTLVTSFPDLNSNGLPVFCFTGLSQQLLWLTLPLPPPKPSTENPPLFVSVRATSSSPVGQKETHDGVRILTIFLPISPSFSPFLPVLSVCVCVCVCVVRCMCLRVCVFVWMWKVMHF